MLEFKIQGVKPSYDSHDHIVLEEVRNWTRMFELPTLRPLHGD